MIVQQTQTLIFQDVLGRLKSQLSFEGPSSLSNTHPLRADIKRYLSLIKGGRLSHEVSVLRSWAQGDSVEPELLGITINRFLTHDSEILTAILNEENPGIKLFYTPPTVCEDVPHTYQPVRLKDLTIDPILDFEPCKSILDFLENSTDQGARFYIKSLKLFVFTEPQATPLSINELYQKINDGQHTSLLFEDALYVVHNDNIPPNVKASIAEALRLGFFTQALPISVTAGARYTGKAAAQSVSNSPTPYFSDNVPWEEIKKISHRRWIQGLDEPKTESFEPMPTLKAMLDRSKHLLHDTDLENIWGSIHKAQAHCVGSQVYEAEMLTLRSRIAGILGEIENREAIIQTYRKSLTSHPDMVLLVEGQISTTNKHAISDAILGEPGEGTSPFCIHHAYEISTQAFTAGKMAAQHQHTLENRLPSLGMSIELDQDRTYSVAVDTAKTERHIVISSEAQHVALAGVLDQIEIEIKGYLALQKGLAHCLSLKEKRRLQHNKKGSGVGRFFNRVIEELWEELDRKSHAKKHDLSWLVAQLEARLPFAPMDIQERLMIYIACLRNVSPLLGEKREPLATVIKNIPAKVSLPYNIISHLNDAVLQMLAARQLPILEDPLKEEKKARVGGGQRNQLIKKIWAEKTPQEVYTHLQKAIDEDEDPASKKFLEGYAVILKNMSLDLNDSPDKKRLTEKELSQRISISATQIGRNIEDISKQLTDKGWAEITDPERERKARLKQGHAISKKLAGLWESPTQKDVVQELESRIAAEKDQELLKELKGYLQVLLDIAPLPVRSEEAQTRSSPQSLAARCGLTVPKIIRFQKEIIRELGEKEWPYLENPYQMLGEASVAAKNAKAAIHKAWKLESPEAFVNYLESELATHEGKESKNYLIAYLGTFKNLIHNQKINLKGRRRPLSFIIKASKTGYGIVKEYEREVVAQLALKEWPLLPQPEVVRGQSLDARFEVASIFLLAGIEKWDGKKIKDEITSCLTDHDEDNQQALHRLLAIFEEYSKELNTSGKAKTPNELATDLGAHSKTINSYAATLGQLMKDAGVASLYDSSLSTSDI